MNPTPDYGIPVLGNVLLASDFSAGSLTAFHHALKVALVAESRLTILHLSLEAATAWTELTGVPETIERWRLSPPGSPQSDASQIGIEVRKVVAPFASPVKSVLRYLEEHPADLIVLATHVQDGRASWLQKSLGEPIARRAGQMTLYLPDRVPGFVSAKDGAVSLSRILIPIVAKPCPQPAVAAAARLAARLQRPKGTFILMHVGKEGSMPEVDCPAVSGWQWEKVTRTGDVIHGIVDAAGSEAADLIVMSTDGRNGFLDALRGSHSERVLRSAPCPLLTVPEGSLAADAVR